MSEKILIVEDEETIADLVKLYLKNNGFEVFIAGTGKDAISIINNTPIDLAILDVMLPDIDGFKICVYIRKEHTYPIIMLTAKDGEIDRINGLTLGADDYVAKPFSSLELVARVKAQLRRYKLYDNTNANEHENSDKLIFYKGLTLNKDAHEFLLNCKKVSLTPTEFSILWMLVANHGKVISSEDIFFNVWGEKYYENANATVMVHIRHLRKKMIEKVGSTQYIKTVWGVGYKIDE